MPWSIKKQSGKYCVVNSETGKTEKCHDSRPKAVAHQKALYANVPDAKLEEIEKITLEGVGPALIAVAATNKPHLRQRGGDITITDDGQVRIPVARKGIYRHRLGPLVFNDTFFSRMIDNFNQGVTDYPVHLDLRHKDTEGALAWLDPADGGRLAVEGDWLVAYGQPTDEKSIGLIKSKRYRYSSAEIAKDYQSNLVQKLSTEELEPIKKDDLTPEVNMSYVLKLGEASLEVEVAKDSETYTLTSEHVDAIEAFAEQVAQQSEATAAQVKQLEADLAQLKKEKIKLEADLEKTKPKDDLQLPDEVRLRLEALEAQNADLRRQSELEKAAFALQRAKELGHDKVLIDLVGHGLRLESFTNHKGETIQLEEGSETSFYRNLLLELIEKVPPAVPTKNQTHGTETKLESNGSGYTDEELTTAVEQFLKF